MQSVIPTSFEPRIESFPYPTPYILSSAERYWCSEVPGQESARKVYIKRRHLEENLKTFEREIGMDEAERKRFLDHWCSPSLRSPELIRAELDECFNIRTRAESWMERARPASQAQRSRLEKYAESAQQFYKNAQSKTVSTGPAGTQGFGYADIPDEQ